MKILSLFQDLKYKRQISHLEYEQETANKKLLEYEATVTSMEFEMLNMQKIWKVKANREKIGRQKIDSEDLIPEQDKKIPGEEEEGKPTNNDEMIRNGENGFLKVNKEKEIVELKEGNDMKPESRCNSTQTEIITQRSIEIQCELKFDYSEFDSKREQKEIILQENKKQIKRDDYMTIFHKEQLNKALALASERSAIILKYESQLTEYQTKINSLTSIIEDKDAEIGDRDNIIDQINNESNVLNTDISDTVALNSTINTLQKLLGQKEETISRYQMLLKEDRDEHSKVKNILQEEIKHLQEKIALFEKDEKIR